MQTTTRNNQTLLDIAVQECGTVEAAFEIAERNGLALTDELNTGQKLDIVMTTTREESVVQELAALETVPAVDNSVLARYEAQHIRPATELSSDEISMAPYGGIGFMGIEIDFVVR